MTQIIPSPPRLTGNPANDTQILQDYLTTLWGALVKTGRVLDRLDSIQDLGTLTLTISNPPTQAQVTQVLNKVNAIITAATV